MEEINKVSVWMGKSKSETELKKYIKEIYNDEGEMSSEFMINFKIEFYDNQFIEVLFTQGTNKNDIFKDFSYSEKFIKEIPNKDFNNFNSFILLYNFAYNKSKNESNNFIYIGDFNYR